MVEYLKGAYNMIDYDSQLTVDIIINAMKKLEIFSLEQLEKEIALIPNSTFKEHCIEWILNSSEIEQVFGIYCILF